MKELKSYVSALPFLLILFSAGSATAAEVQASTRGADDGRPLVLVDPSAKEIIRSHEQRIVNIQYEMDQVMNLINQYTAYKRRLEQGVTALPKNMNTKTLQVGIDREIEKYWKLYNLLNSAKELLRDSPPLKIKMSKDYKPEKR
ncbi:hypothetical protein [Aeromonas caviae]|jgi:hypothetical protein|uniref:hypothetical protein n=1 Tax=Aeromonas caviae TaxID=648 RepID=UPI00385E6436